MSSNRWDAAASVAKCHVFSGHKRERQSDAGTACIESKLPHKLSVIPYH